ncbi:MAG: sortase [Patescibacteria group bacterium]|nr:sortase [Patescibacteria group bacterium]
MYNITMVDSSHFAQTVHKRVRQKHLDLEPHPYQVHRPVERSDVFVAQKKVLEPHIPHTKNDSHLKQRMTSREKVFFVLMRTFGNFLLLISLYGVAATFGPALSSEVQFRVAQARGVRYVIQEPNPVPITSAEVTPVPVQPGFGSAIIGAQEQVIIPPDTNFSIIIPKLGATSRVIPNVDPTNETEFTQELGKGVAHAKGTVFPGMKGNVYLFAHSTDSFWNVGRYNAVFYLIKDLKPQDEVILYFEGRRYTYIVEKSEIKDATDVDYLIKSQSGEGENLILQTCWPPGTTWKRLYVIARTAS